MLYELDEINTLIQSCCKPNLFCKKLEKISEPTFRVVLTDFFGSASGYFSSSSGTLGWYDMNTHVLLTLVVANKRATLATRPLNEKRMVLTFCFIVLASPFCVIYFYSQ